MLFAMVEVVSQIVTFGWLQAGGSRLWLKAGHFLEMLFRFLGAICWLRSTRTVQLFNYEPISPNIDFNSASTALRSV